MNVLKINGFGLKMEFKFELENNIQEFKDVIYSILMVAPFYKFETWFSTHLEKGEPGHLVFQFYNERRTFNFNFVFKAESNLKLKYFKIYNHLLEEEKYYQLTEYNKMYNDFVELIS